MLHGWQYLTAQDRENIMRGAADGGVHGGPYHIELDWVDRCNARCFFCNSESTHNGHSIPWERTLGLLEEAVAGGLHSIRLSGGGEPTMHPHFTDLIHFLNQSGIVLDNLTTNGILLNDAAIEALTTVRLTDMRVSLNYPTAETYATGMRLAAKTFDRVVDQTRKLSEARRRNPHFGLLMIQFFIHKPTVGLIRESYRLGRELGVDLITYRELAGIDPALEATAGDAPAIIEQMREIIREDWGTGHVECLLESHGMRQAIAKIYDELHAELGGTPRWAPVSVNDRNRYCYIPWYSMTIMGNQAVYPCCFLMPLAGIAPLGNLAGASLGEVWRGKAFGEVRHQMRDFMLLQRQVPLFDRRVNRITRACASHTGCPMTRSMCDEAFYEAAERRLEAVRRQPGTALWRLANRAGRFIERKLGRPY